MPIQSQLASSYILAIVMFALPVTVHEIMTFDLSKWSVFESMTFKKWVNIMSCNVAELSLNGVLMAYMIVKNGAFISNRVRLVYQRGVHMNRHPYTQALIHTHSDTLRRMQ